MAATRIRRLTDSDVRCIRQMRLSGCYTTPEIAARFRVSEATVFDVATRRRKKHVQDEGPTSPIPELPSRKHPSP